MLYCHFAARALNACAIATAITTIRIDRPISLTGKMLKFVHLQTDTRYTVLGN